MIKLNDHYFIAWLKIVKNIKINTLNGIKVDMTSKEYTEYLKEYNQSLKPILKEVRKTVKELNSLTSQPK